MCVWCIVPSIGFKSISLFTSIKTPPGSSIEAKHKGCRCRFVMSHERNALTARGAERVMHIVSRGSSSGPEKQRQRQRTKNGGRRGPRTKTIAWTCLSLVPRTHARTVLDSGLTPPCPQLGHTHIQDVETDHARFLVHPSTHASIVLFRLCQTTPIHRLPTLFTPTAQRQRQRQQPRRPTLTSFEEHPPVTTHQVNQANQQ